MNSGNDGPNYHGGNLQTHLEWLLKTKGGGVSKHSGDHLTAQILILGIGVCICFLVLVVLFWATGL